MSYITRHCFNTVTFSTPSCMTCYKCNFYQTKKNFFSVWVVKCTPVVTLSSWVTKTKLTVDAYKEMFFH